MATDGKQNHRVGEGEVTRSGVGGICSVIARRGGAGKREVGAWLDSLAGGAPEKGADPSERGVAEGQTQEILTWMGIRKK